jgi:osmotically-inducible protein OsmY
MSMHVANVIVNNGIAQIYGWVASNMERRALHVVVENTQGVREVDDYLHRTPPYV